MNERSLHIIQAYLQREDVQERIRQNIQRGRSEATVTIGRAARLFDFTENRLRDWEALGLLTPLKPTGQRQYTPEELDKLAIIKELIDEGGYTPSTIPPDIDRIWASIASRQQGRAMKDGEGEVEHLHIEERLKNARADLFLRYFASHALKLSLMLICEDIPNTTAGLVVPLYKDAALPVSHVEDLPKVGESLIGLLGRRGSFQTFLTSEPSLWYSTDYRLLRLQVMREDEPEEEASRDDSLILVDRQSNPLTLNKVVVETIRRFLAPLYEEAEDLRSCFGPGMRDVLEPAPNFGSGTSYADIILNGLADMIVRLGGRTDDGKHRWRFCCIMLPEDSQLPLQQRNLVVEAQSKNSPHKRGVTTIFPDKYVNSLSLRAFQSGHIIYRQEISPADTTIAFRELEGPIHSAIAVPLGGEKGQALAVLYIVSDDLQAFTEEDQRVLRMMGRIVEELLLTYRARCQAVEKLGDLIKAPSKVDRLFAGFLSENEFIQDVELLFASIKTRMSEREVSASKDSAPVAEYTPQFEEVVSFIGIDLDNQSALTNKYGDGTMRNLSRTIGLRVQEMIQALITKHTDCKLYYIYAARYYVLLKGIPLEQARTKAETIRQALQGPISIEQPNPPVRPLALPDVTIRLGVSSYTYTKLEENLTSDSSENIVAEVRVKATRALDVALNMGKDEGGNVVFAWNPEMGGFTRWTPSRTE